MRPPKEFLKIFSRVKSSRLFLVAISFYISYRLLHPPRKKQEQTPKDFCLKYKKIQFRSKDKTLLKGWMVKSENPKGLIILSHGYSHDKQSLLPAVRELYKNNYDSLVFDYRAHGESAGNKTTIGALEQEDLAAAIGFAKRFSNKIGIFGISMGAVTSIIVATKTAGLRCIVADSSYAGLEQLIYEKSPLLKNLIVRFMEFQGAEIGKSNAIDYVNRLPVPIFFIHGNNDELVDFRHSLKLFNKARNPKKLWIVKGGRHGRSYFENKQEYSGKVIGFFDQNLS